MEEEKEQDIRNLLIRRIETLKSRLAIIYEDARRTEGELAEARMALRSLMASK